MYVYLITNLINNKKYVGQTLTTLKKRFARHCWASTTNAKKMPISTAIGKYSKENFIIELLCECSSTDELNEKELYYAQLYNTFSPNGYNLKAGGRKTFYVSDETKNKISIGNMGKTRSDETKRKLSISHLGNIPSDETRQKLSDANKGKRGSDLCYQRSVEVNQKTYHFISPRGEKITIVNMRQFCLLNNLSPSKMTLVSQEKRNHHKGWKLVPILEEKI